MLGVFVFSTNIYIPLTDLVGRKDVNRTENQFMQLNVNVYVMIGNIDALGKHLRLHHLVWSK